MSDQTDHLVCPYCGAGDDPDAISVYRDGKATRHCRECWRSWLPAADPPEAGGPYVRPRVV